MAARSGIRDTATTPRADKAALTELYWDAILLTESEFLDSGYHDYTGFQRQVVRQVGQALTTYERGHKAPFRSSSVALWRQIGLSYSLLYYPDWFQNPIWCKSDSTRLQVILSQDISQVVKQLLMSLLEYTATLDLAWLRLCVLRDVTGIKDLLRNLSWLGGRVVPNENRTAALDSLTALECATFSDEKYVIVEFEC
ncbi:Oaz1p [Lachancea thermotolerans CBS 6340]|uniref:KLTH0E11704p n=1 Tax=Lachancea thermotolerans (strain ATCC 56472 / CBS 6340 / NRRL Y-8284) TaxID=559295 RepID=C5DID7_LACTC|nr:KLTH0E11704p [Lachancea thermotolerans CBS 6340]CAR23548.1 KLTH0E11704p [Lachancea thermotolerans CBS 6340]